MIGDEEKECQRRHSLQLRFSKFLMASLLTPRAQFDYEPYGLVNHGQKWTTWLRRFNLWMTSAELSAKSDTIKIAKLVNTVVDKRSSGARDCGKFKEQRH